VNVFDVDGCLVDTLPMVLAAYVAAGAEGTTNEHVRSPWQEWLPGLVGDRAEEVRARKTEIYLASLIRTPPMLLPAGRLAIELVAAGEPVAAISAAKASVVPVVLAAAGIPAIRYFAEVTREDRPRLLADLAPAGTYYDDDWIACDLVHAGTAWTAIRV
jgi:beta-phosphoglucomutase-like phosphatase (HAD superfamily)